MRERGDEQRRARARRRPGVAGGREGVVEPGQRPVGGRRARRWRRASSGPASRGRRGGRTPGAATRRAPPRGGGARRRPSPPSPCTRRGRSARPGGAGARPRWGRAGAGSRPRPPSGRRRRVRGEPEERDHAVDVDEQQGAGGGVRAGHGAGSVAATGAHGPPRPSPALRRHPRIRGSAGPAGRRAWMKRAPPASFLRVTQEGGAHAPAVGEHAGRTSGSGTPSAFQSKVPWTGPTVPALVDEGRGRPEAELQRRAVRWWVAPAPSAAWRSSATTVLLRVAEVKSTRAVSGGRLGVASAVQRGPDVERDREEPGVGPARVGPGALTSRRVVGARIVARAQPGPPCTPSPTVATRNGRRCRRPEPGRGGPGA